VLQTIFIPTRGRVDRQITLQNLPENIRQEVTLVGDPGEVVALNKKWGQQVHQVIHVGDCSNLSEKRQRCVERASTDYIIFIDDNCTFHTIHHSDRGQITKSPIIMINDKNFTSKSQKHHLNQLFNWIITQLQTDKYGMVGVSHRPDVKGLSKIDLNSSNLYLLNRRFFAMWGINRKLMLKLPGSPKFNDVILMQDFYMILQFLTNGIPVIKTYEYAFDKQGSNTEGGCSTYRTPELLLSESLKLQRMFPGFVTIKNKGTSNWKRFGNQTIGIILHTKKAYDNAIHKKHAPKGFGLV
jgi:glycosyltransferase involved in cell wall biosynthesis